MDTAPEIIRPNANLNIGVVGPKGSSLLSGLGPPDDALGTDDDLYLDRQNANIYGPRVDGAWPDTYLSLIGPRGENGPQILSGTGTPADTIGFDNDYFLDRTNSILYGPKTAGHWPNPGVVLIGGPGPSSKITIGTVTTLAPGSPATADLDGTSPNQTLNLGIPQGPAGATGNGSGNVLGPSGGATNGHIALFDGGTGTFLKDAGIDPTTLATVTALAAAIAPLATTAALSALAASLPTRGQIVALALGSPL